MGKMMLRNFRRNLAIMGCALVVATTLTGLVATIIFRRNAHLMMPSLFPSTMMH